MRTTLKNTETDVMTTQLDQIQAAQKLLHRPPSERSAIDAFIAMEVMRAANERAAAGERLVRMEVGQPGTPAPRRALEAVTRALGADTMGYTDALGLPRLRERIAQHYRDWYGVQIATDRVVVTTGSSGAFLLAFLSLFDVGAGVGMTTPGYPCYRQILSALGHTPVAMPIGPETGWMPTPGQIDDLVATDKIAGVVIASPANPTGRMLDRDSLTGLVSACQRGRIWYISDEIYHGLTYNEPATTALSLSDDVIVINSFSKYFSMTGWRIGWMIVPDGLQQTIERLAQNFFISPPHVSQIAALAALEAGEELEANKAIYAQNRRVLLDGLAQAGLSRIVPADGAFYIYADVSDFTQDSLTFARTMLAEIGLAATPGADFDPERGHQFMRFSYAGSTDDMREGVQRIGGWLAALKQDGSPRRG